MATELPQVLEGARRLPRPLAIGGHGLAEVWRFTRRKPLGGISLAIIVMFLALAVFAPLIAPHDPKHLYFGSALAGIGERPEAGGAPFLLGADRAGRDQFSRIVFGSRISFSIGVVATTIGITIGTLLGLLSGYKGGKLDLVIQRVIDSMMAFPALILALVIMSLLGAELRNVVLAIGIILVPTTTRVVRGTALSVKENVYIEAARAIGAGDTRIMLRHVLPNVTHAVIIVAATYLGAAILVEASLSFLGFGAGPGAATWGQMISGAGREYMIQRPLLLWAPATALAMLVLSFNLLGDALRDVWDPRLRGTQK